MNDFSAAAMLRLIRLGLKRQGLAAPDFLPPRSAHIPLSDKRSLLHNVLTTYGAMTVLRIGDAVKDAPDEPMMTALMLAKDPLDLLARWQRLERFVHSKHRTRILDSEPGRLVLQHFAYRGKKPPWPEEDLLIFGLLVAMIEKIEISGLKARAIGITDWPRADGEWIDTQLPNDVSTWELTWRPDLTGKRSERPHVGTVDWLDMARQALQSDPGRAWSIDALADELHTSSRTLQRRLKSESSSFSSLVAEVRMAAAAELLGRTAQSPAEIGYVCGFSDQAHFTRDFKRYTAFTPSAFREQFVSS